MERDKKRVQAAAVNESAAAGHTHRTIKMRRLKSFEEENSARHIAMVAASMLCFFILWFVVTRFSRPAGFLSRPETVFSLLIERIKDGYYLPDVTASLRRVVIGYVLGMIVAIPVAFAMGWYKSVRDVIEPWIQFLRTIPPLAYIPIMVVAFGVGEKSKYAIIFLATFLTTSITVCQGILEMDKVLIKAAYTFGAKDRDIFLAVTLPASLPYILIAARTALAGSFTTLIAAEMTGATVGLGARIQLASSVARIDLVMLGIFTIGLLGFVFDRMLLLIEKFLTRWK